MISGGKQHSAIKWSPFASILLLFIFMRLSLLLFFSPQGLINAYSDYYYYYRIAQLSDEGYFPFINMWYEYPPILAYLPLVVYRITQVVAPGGDIFSIGYQLFARMLGMIFLAFETGVLVLIYETAKEVWSKEKALWLGWVYSALSLPLFFFFIAHQSVVVFFMMLAIFWFITKKYAASAIALGLGVAAKLVPIILVPPVMKFLWPRYKKVLVYALVVAVVFLLQYIPFVSSGSLPWVTASFNALSNVGSYGTLWAIIDGNWGPGTYGPIPARLDITQAGLTHANPEVLPGWVILLIFGLIYIFLLLRPNNVEDPKEFIWFSTLTWIIFLLYIKGWSPHWAVMLVPLLLLSFPDNLGLFLTLLLTGIVFLEWPVGEAISSKSLSVIIISSRLIFFISVLSLLIRRLWPSQQGDRLTQNA